MFKKILLIIFSFIVLNNFFDQQIDAMQPQLPSTVFKSYEIQKEIALTQEHVMEGIYTGNFDVTIFQDEESKYLILSDDEIVIIYKITPHGPEYFSGFSCDLYFKEIFPIKDSDQNIHLAITSTNLVNYPNKKIFVYSLENDSLKKINADNIISSFTATTDSAKNILLVSAHCKKIAFWTLDGVQVSEINNQARLSALHTCQTTDQTPYILTADNMGNLTIWNHHGEIIKCYQTGIRFSAVHLQYNPDNSYQIIAASKESLCILNQTDDAFNPGDHLKSITPSWSDVVIKIIPAPEAPLIIMYALLKEEASTFLALSIYTIDQKHIGIIYSDFRLKRLENILQAFCTPDKLFIVSHVNTSLFLQSCPIMSFLES
ncbi:hypothetical protein JST56_05000 [Candidatus Dependentiae bacterium]|nr:hypothetical protein [Candidatus Dependentiae bacterium]